MEDLAQLLVGGGVGSAAATSIVMMIRSLKRGQERLTAICEKNSDCIQQLRSIIERELHPNSGSAPLAERVANIEVRLETLDRRR